MYHRFPSDTSQGKTRVKITEVTDYFVRVNDAGTEENGKPILSMGNAL